MESKEYKRARDEFINCLLFGIIGFGVPFVLAFKVWWPIMKREKQKSMQQGKGAENTCLS